MYKRQVIDGVSEKLTKLLNRLNSVEDDEKVQAFMEFMKRDPEGYGEFFSQPEMCIRDREMAEGYVTGIALDENNEVIGYQFVSCLLYTS